MADSGNEGIKFYRDSTHVDSLWVKSGVIYFTPNMEVTTDGCTGTVDNVVLHSGNISSYAITSRGYIGTTAVQASSAAQNLTGIGSINMAGDIIVAYETVLKESRMQNKSFEAHLAHLLIHGTLHLQGYDHLEEKEAQKMEKLETKLMKSLGYDDPYKDVE